MSRVKANNFTKKVLYQLKKWHGQSVDLYLRGAVSQNVETGVPTYPETKWKIKRAPVLEIASAFAEIKAQNLAVAGRPFEYGGTYNLNQTSVIVEQKNLPANYIANKNDSFIIRHKRYSITDHQVFQEEQLTVFVIQELVGQAVSEIYDVADELIVTEGIILT